MPNYQGIDDDYLPATPKPSLQQYDNYQIHDLYCVDIIYTAIPNLSAPVPPPVLFKKFLAVERASLLPIPIDFEAIATTYK